MNNRMHARLRRIVVTLVLLHGFSSAVAGPPLSIDDPGILDPGKLEIITAVTLTSDDGGDYRQLPVVDVSLGVIEDYVQVSFVHSYASVNRAGAGSERDFGSPQAGVKWRFLNDDRLQMAIAPYYSFGVSGSAAGKGIGDASGTAVFPVNAEYQVNDVLRLNGEVRYADANNAGNEWSYGAAVAFALDDRRELLFELAGRSGGGSDSGFTEARVGLDASLSDSLHLLISFATGLTAPAGVNKLDQDFFLGVQYFP